MEHSFDIDIAKEYGIPAAILLKHIYYWVEKNRANDKHLIEGEYWTYCSVKAFGELFPYMSAKVIRTGLTKLEDGGLIKTGCFNTQIYDRTKWYTLTQNGRSLCRNGKRSLDKKANVFNQNGEPIPYIKPNIEKTTDSVNGFSIVFCKLLFTLVQSLQLYYFSSIHLQVVYILAVVL